MWKRIRYFEKDRINKLLKLSTLWTFAIFNSHEIRFKIIIDSASLKKNIVEIIISDIRTKI